MVHFLKGGRENWQIQPLKVARQPETPVMVRALVPGGLTSKTVALRRGVYGPWNCGKQQFRPLLNVANMRPDPSHTYGAGDR